MVSYSALNFDEQELNCSNRERDATCQHMQRHRERLDPGLPQGGRRKRDKVEAT